jgi:hypothetical protein
MAAQLALGAKPEPVENIGAAGVYDAIVAAHADPEWAVFPEVSDATGMRASRRADAVAFNLWPSRGLEIRGFEIKVSRSDLKRELEDPSKADAIGAYCDSWCLAVPAGMLKDSDPIPPAWGIFVVKGGAGRFQRLPTLRPREETKAPTRLFLAAIARAGSAESTGMRKNGAWVRRESIQAEIDRAFQRGRDSAPDDSREEVHELKSKLKSTEAFLTAIGLDHDKLEFRSAQYAEAMKLGLALWGEYGGSHIARTLLAIEQAIKPLKEVQKALVALESGKAP